MTDDEIDKFRAAERARMRPMREAARAYAKFIEHRGPA